jgi:ABC-type uncharacterized transport system substrate-binding protein
VESFARPGGTATGVSNFSPETGAKQLELLKEIVPSTRDVAVIGNLSNPSWVPERAAREPAAAAWPHLARA